jgi:eukaryotic-like serine/threonine-protein kinase
LAARQPDKAAAQFQLLLDDRGSGWWQVYAPLCELGLARAYAMQEDSAKARAAYNDFFTLWKDADSNIPILQQAKAEYSILQ